ncbi:Ger(x)C family spore germination C-terminal domain-containing protein [Paenibacillus sp. CC-CFT747]|nr:Ger(x)C family spore germination C-terminal domain-containing protein [Paenibacillus sp. CC-CFT747]
MDTTFRDFSIGYYNGGDMVVGILKTERKKLVSEKNKSVLWAGSDGAAVFHNNRMVGALSTKEARGVQWMADKVNNAVITFPSPTDEKPISVLVLNSKTRVRPRIGKDGIVFQVHIYVQDELMSSDSDIPVMEPDNIERLQTRMSEEIKGRIMRAFEKSLQLNSDIFRFAEYMKVYEPKTWEAVKGNWHETYRTKVRLDIQVESRIRRPGETKRSLKSEPKDVG